MSRSEGNKEQFKLLLKTYFLINIFAFAQFFNIAAIERVAVVEEGKWAK